MCKKKMGLFVFPKKSAYVNRDLRAVLCQKWPYVKSDMLLRRYHMLFVFPKKSAYVNRYCHILPHTCAYDTYECNMSKVYCHILPHTCACDTYENKSCRNQRHGCSKYVTSVGLFCRSLLAYISLFWRASSAQDV